MIEKKKLTEGSIMGSLTALAVPIMATSFGQMAYNITDMFWIGRVGSDAVAAVGTAGFFTWFAMAFILISKIGAEVGVAHSIGKDNTVEAKGYIRTSIQINIILGIIYSLILILFRGKLIGFFNIAEDNVVGMAKDYLIIISFGIPFYFINPVLTGIFNGTGDSKTPFKINIIGLISNIILDPILILGLVGMPKLGVTGAAIATILSQFVVTILFIYSIKGRIDIFNRINFLKGIDKIYLKKIIKMGMPPAVQSGLFTVFSMLIARILANWGAVPIAVQKVGSQIEALSWMTAGGFSSALSAFVGQNYGSGKWDRIYKGYFSGLLLVGSIGIGATILFMFGGELIMRQFFSEPDVIHEGIIYLKILGVSQLFMTIEIATAGAFNGLGKTLPPALVSIVLTGARVPMALVLSSPTLLGLNGVWWSISLSSVFKGIVLVIWFIFILKKVNATKSMEIVEAV
ncbi:MATE family efflux transporter [Clostridium sp. D2Q-11]|uniref:Probable multidrug resistance protein NorM n=1 Tax=Anaeromonas frigoriresistens TaxID=2683708 RepID=A0A942UW92_9FIRM|nr:MATE family efflux transporter [Anaeromonas frigoriresistens]MBS4538690.1 MATE family efflux transporter [Anaeromonas frigoriresistens]